MKEITKNRVSTTIKTGLVSLVLTVSLSRGLLAENILNGKKETKKAKTQTVQVAQKVVNGNGQTENGRQEEKYQDVISTATWCTYDGIKFWTEFRTCSSCKSVKVYANGKYTDNWPINKEIIIKEMYIGNPSLLLAGIDPKDSFSYVYYLYNTSGFGAEVSPVF